MLLERISSAVAGVDPSFALALDGFLASLEPVQTSPEPRAALAEYMAQHLPLLLNLVGEQ